MNDHAAHDGALPPLTARLLRVAERKPARALALARASAAACPTEDPAAPAWASLALGTALLRMNQFEEADTQLSQANQWLLDNGQPTASLYARRGLLKTQAFRGAANGWDEWEALARDFEQAGLGLEAARSRFEQIASANLQGMYEEALILAETVAPLVASQGNQSDRARLARLAGVALRGRGHYQEALEKLSTALAGYRALPNRWETAMTTYERAVVYRYNEQPELALADLAAAQPVFVAFDQRVWVAFCQFERAVNLQQLGRLSEAIYLLQQARPALIELGRPRMLADLDLAMGNSFLFCRRYEAALALYQQAETTYEPLGMPHMLATSQRNQVLALVYLGKIDLGLQLLDLLDSQTPDHSHERGERALTRAWVLRHQHQWPEALAALDEAARIFTQQQSPVLVARCELQRGLVLLEQGAIEAASRCFWYCRAALASQPAQAWQVAAGLAACAEATNQPAQALDSYLEASAILAGIRQSVANEHAASAMLGQALAILEHAQQLAASQRQPEAALVLAEQRRATSLAQQVQETVFQVPAEQEAEHARLRRQLQAAIDAPGKRRVSSRILQEYIDLLLHARHSDAPATQAEATVVDPAAMRQQLGQAFPQGWTVLSLSDTGDSIQAVCFAPEHTTVSSITVDTALHQALARVTDPAFSHQVFVDIRAGGQPSNPWAELSLLGERLIPQAVQQRLEAGHRLLIIASRQLQQVPWAGLCLGGRWLAEQAVIQVIPSLRVWHQLQQRPAPAPEALLVGVHAFGNRAQPLENVGPSLDLIEQIWQGETTRLESPNVTLENLQQQAADGRLRRFGHLHIATHGHLHDAKGLLAHLKIDDTNLLYADITQLALGSASVMLAACEGAAGEALPGDEVLSLSRAFLVAGARDVIASQWPIYDRALLGLLEPFYRQLAAGHDAPSALAYAQRSMIAQHTQSSDIYHAIRTSPLVWAGFSALGAGT